MNGVKVPVELQGGSRSATIEHRQYNWGFGPICSMPLDGKAVSGQNLFQSICGCARAASGAGNLNQSYSSF